MRDNADVWQKIQHWRWHKNHRNARKTTPWDMFAYISGDFVFNLYYMIITNSDSDDYCNPLYPEPSEEHILPRYMLRNFLLFRAAVTDCIMGKFPNDLDFWIYARRYLLMDDKEFAHCGYGPNGKIFRI